MKNAPRSTPPQSSSRVIRYALFIGVIVVIAIVAGSLIGKRSENPRPAGNLTSPAP